VDGGCHVVERTWERSSKLLFKPSTKQKSGSGSFSQSKKHNQAGKKVLRRGWVYDDNLKREDMNRAEGRSV